MLRSGPVLAILGLLSGCGLPLDPGKTSERLAATHELRVGVTDNSPLTDAQTAIPRALKTEMSGEILSLIPPTLFLIGDRISRRPPNRFYAFGHECAVSAGNVGAAVALLLAGLFLVFGGAMKLVTREHPTVGGFPLLGHVMWTGWLGIAVLLWGSIRAFGVRGGPPAPIAAHGIAVPRTPRRGIAVPWRTAELLG